MDTRPVSTPISTPMSQTPSSGPQEATRTGGAKRVKDMKDGGGARGASERRDWDVQISPEAVELAEARRKAMNVAKQTSPVREDRVADLKRRIADGSYKVESGKIADGMMTEAIKDHVASSPDEYWDNE